MSYVALLFVLYSGFLCVGLSHVCRQLSKKETMCAPQLFWLKLFQKFASRNLNLRVSIASMVGDDDDDDARES